MPGKAKSQVKPSKDRSMEEIPRKERQRQTETERDTHRKKGLLLPGRKNRSRVVSPMEVVGSSGISGRGEHGIL